MFEPSKNQSTRIVSQALLICLVLGGWLFVNALSCPASAKPYHVHAKRAFQEGQDVGSMQGPTPKYVHHGNGVVHWSGVVTGEGDVKTQYPVLFDHITEAADGVPIAIVVSPKLAPNTPEIAGTALSHEEGYWLRANKDGIHLQASSMSGVARGLVRIIDASSTMDGGMPTGQWADWPNMRVRVLQFVINANDNLSTLKKVVDIAVKGQFNTLLVQVNPKTVDLSSFGSLAEPGGLSQSDFEKFNTYARESGLAIVPSLKLLTHQEKLLGNHYPKYMYNTRTYDPNNPGIYKIVFPIISQLIDLTRAKAFMIGHDEVYGSHHGDAEKLQAIGEKILPASLFLKDTLTLNKYLQDRGITPWMWGDMLESPSEFPNMFASSLHGGVAEGYGSPLMKQLPKDIVICDWHYFGHDVEYPTLNRFINNGFRVIGATWKNPRVIRTFSDYAVNNGAEGMIATTWSSPEEQLGVVTSVARESADQFWNAGGR